MPGFVCDLHAQQEHLHFTVITPFSSKAFIALSLFKLNTMSRIFYLVCDIVQGRIQGRGRGSWIQTPPLGDHQISLR